MVGEPELVVGSEHEHESVLSGVAVEDVDGSVGGGVDLSEVKAIAALGALLYPLGEEGGSLVEGEFSSLQEDIAETEILSAHYYSASCHVGLLR